jgi:hypothetical protein
VSKQQADTLLFEMMDLVGLWPVPSTTPYAVTRCAARAAVLVRRWEAAGRPVDCEEVAGVLACYPSAPPTDSARDRQLRLRAEACFGEWVEMRKLSILAS